MKTVNIFSDLQTQRVIRLTLVKGFNMINPHAYAHLIEKASPDYVEAKAYMYVGYSRYRMTMDNMPSYKDIEKFSSEIANKSDYEIADFQKASRVVLLKRT